MELPIEGSGSVFSDLSRSSPKRLYEGEREAAMLK